MLQMPVSERFVQRLNKASANRRFYPFDQDIIDWSVPITDDHLYMPKDISVFRNAPFFEELTRSEQSFLTRYEITQLFRNIGHGEHLLNQAMLSHLWHVSQYDPSWRFMLHEVAEECQHMLMFSEWLRRNPDIRTTGIAEEVIGPGAAFISTTLVARFGQAPGWILILVFEAVGEVINRSLRSAADVHPILQQIGRTHSIEEGRHIAYAEAWLKGRLAEMGRVQRLALQIFTECLSLYVLRAHRFLPLPYSEQIGHLVSREQFLEAKKSSPANAAYREHAESTIENLAKHGFIRPKMLEVWRSTGLLQGARAAAG